MGHVRGRGVGDTLTGLGVPEDAIGQIGAALSPLRGDSVTAR